MHISTEDEILTQQAATPTQEFKISDKGNNDSHEVPNPPKEDNQQTRTDSTNTITSTQQQEQPSQTSSHVSAKDGSPNEQVPILGDQLQISNKENMTWSCNKHQIHHKMISTKSSILISASFQNMSTNIPTPLPATNLAMKSVDSVSHVN